MPDDLEAIKLAPSDDALPPFVSCIKWDINGRNLDVLEISVVHLLRLQLPLRDYWHKIPLCSNYVMENDFTERGMESTVCEDGKPGVYRPSQSTIQRHSCVSGSKGLEKILIKPYWYQLT